MKADSWILRELPELLVEDWWDLNINNEFDMQVAAYFHLRSEHLRGSDRWILRTQPLLDVEGGRRRVKPDIVRFKMTQPYDAIELKCMLDGFSWTVLEKDLEKLRLLKEEGFRHAYVLVLYDDDENIDLHARNKADWMKDYLTFCGGNVRRRPSTTARKSRVHASLMKRSSDQREGACG